MKYIVISLIAITIGGIIWWNMNMECISSHEEQSVELPPTMNVGGGKYGGGIGIPLGNGKIVTKTVCDDYQRITKLKPIE